MPKQLHIVHIIPSLRFGGAEKMVTDLVNYLPEKQFRSTILLLSPEFPLKEALTKGEVRLLPRGSVRTRTRDIEQVLRDIEPDIVHTHLFGADVWGGLAAARLHIPVVSTEHNVNYSEGMLRALVKRWVWNYVRPRHVAVSAAVAGYMERTYRVPLERVTVIHNGIDIKQFTHIPDPAFVHPLRFLLLGRLTKQKGHHIALHALARMKQFDWKATIVGDGEEDRDIESLITTLKLQDRIMMLPFTHDVAAVYAAHDIVIVPSLWEGLGMVVMEAMAAGRLVVASQTGGIPELIRDKHTGILFDVGDAGSLRTELGWCLHSRDHARLIAQEGRIHALKTYDIADMVEQYEKIYEDVANI